MFTRTQRRSPLRAALLAAAVLSTAVFVPTTLADTAGQRFGEDATELLGLDADDHVLEVSTSIRIRDTLAGLQAPEIADLANSELSRQVQSLIQSGAITSRDDLFGLVLAVTLEGHWSPPGCEWMGVEDVTIVGAYDGAGAFRTGIVGFLPVGSTTLTIAASFGQGETEFTDEAADDYREANSTDRADEPTEADAERDRQTERDIKRAKRVLRDRQFTLIGLADDFSVGDMRDFAWMVGLATPFDQKLRDDALVFSDVFVLFEMMQDSDLSTGVRFDAGISIAATTTLMGTIEANALFTKVPSADGRGDLMLGLHVRDFVFGDVVPELEGTDVGDLVFPDVAITVARDHVTMGSDEMNLAQSSFFDGIFGEGDYELDFVPGVNFGAALPLSNLPAELLEPLGMSPADVVVVEGAPGISFGLSGGFGFRPADMYLRAKLPPMSPPGAPAWFVDGQLALEVTGRPSVAMVGELTVDVQGDELTFFVKGTIGRDGANASFALAGGLEAEEPWESPFGIEWMTFNRASVKVSINTIGSLGLGFDADLAIGEKDIDVAVFVAVNLATGVPTNFIFDGQSDAGVALSDLVQLQQRIAAAARPNAPRLNVNRLPDAAVRKLRLKFAPKDDPDLGVEMGLAISGELLLKKSRDGKLEPVAGIDLAIDENGIVGEAFVGAVACGPIMWDDAAIDLALTVEEQRLAMYGGAYILGEKRQLDIDLTPQGMVSNMIDAFYEHSSAAFDRARARAEQARAQAEQAAAAARRARAEARSRIKARAAKVSRWRR